MTLLWHNGHLPTVRSSAVGNSKQILRSGFNRIAAVNSPFSPLKPLMKSVTLLFTSFLIWLSDNFFPLILAGNIKSHPF